MSISHIEIDGYDPHEALTGAGNVEVPLRLRALIGLSAVSLILGGDSAQNTAAEAVHPVAQTVQIDSDQTDEAQAWTLSDESFTQALHDIESARTPGELLATLQESLLGSGLTVNGLDADRATTDGTARPIENMSEARAAAQSTLHAVQIFGDSLPRLGVDTVTLAGDIDQPAERRSRAAQTSVVESVVGSVKEGREIVVNATLGLGAGDEVLHAIGVSIAESQNVNLERFGDLNHPSFAGYGVERQSLQPGFTSQRGTESAADDFAATLTGMLTRPDHNSVDAWDKAKRMYIQNNFDGVIDLEGLRVAARSRQALNRDRIMDARETTVPTMLMEGFAAGQLNADSLAQQLNMQPGSYIDESFIAQNPDGQETTFVQMRIPSENGDRVYWFFPRVEGVPDTMVSLDFAMLSRDAIRAALDIDESQVSNHDLDRAVARSVVEQDLDDGSAFHTNARRIMRQIGIIQAT